MALAYTNEVDLLGVNRQDGAVQRVVGCTVTFDAAYAAAGEPLDATQVVSSNGGALSAIDFVVVASSRSTGTELVTWDRTNAKLRVWTSDGVEASGDISTVTAELLIFGR